MPSKGNISGVCLQALAENSLQDKAITQRTSFIFPRLMHVYIQREKSKGVCKRGRERRQRDKEKIVFSQGWRRLKPRSGKLPWLLTCSITAKLLLPCTKCCYLLVKDHVNSMGFDIPRGISHEFQDVIDASSVRKTSEPDAVADAARGNGVRWGDDWNDGSWKCWNKRCWHVSIKYLLEKTHSSADLQSFVWAQSTSHNTISNSIEKNPLSYTKLLQLVSCWAFESFKLRKEESKKFNLLDCNNTFSRVNFKKS